MKKQFDWKKWIPNVVILLIFALASVIYFQPALEGKIIASSDGIHGRAATEECVAYHEQTGDYSYWSGSMKSMRDWKSIPFGQSFIPAWSIPAPDL